MKKNKSIDDSIIIPIRIREARIASGISMSELAEKIGVTKQAISKYELGAINISSSVMLKIAQVLGFPLNFFYKAKMQKENCFPESIVFYRSLRSANKKVKDALEQKLHFLNEIYTLLSDYIDFPDVYKLPINIDKEPLNDERIEEIALELREYWGLSQKPINNLTNLLLKKGYIISRVKLNTLEVDAFSHWLDGRYYIIIGSDKGSSVRTRFDLAHELGHSIMHLYVDENEFKKNHKAIENEANKFASAFLMPREEFTNDIVNISLDNFVYMKEKWKTSVASMIVRCRNLDLITDEQYTNLYKQLIARKWRTKEPLDDVIKFEIPTMLKEAFDLIFEHGAASPEEVVRFIALQEDEIERLCFLPEGYFQRLLNKRTKPVLKIVR